MNAPTSPITLDARDKQLLQLLQSNASLSLDDLAEQVHLSRNACWSRIKRLEEAQIIRARRAILDPEAVNLGLTAFISVRTRQHSASWVKLFRDTVAQMPELTAIYRTSGNIDYLLVAMVPDMKAFDALYQKLIKKVEFSEVSSTFVMERIKDTTELPLNYV